ncbi:MAG: glycosyltransferase family 2 protein [Gemmatimonadota bacterium]|nr:glycosyltransferase family 2 protein [Gemmatimonadota bacterium]
MSRIDAFVSVIVPLRDDADILAAVVAELDVVLSDHYRHYEIVLVDDGSTDGTVDAAQRLLDTHPDLRLVRLSRRFGQEIAISAGLDTVIGDYVVVLLPDSDPPDVIPDMVEQARQGAGVVFGVRRSRAGEPWLQRLGARLFYGLAGGLLGISIPRDTTHLRVLSRQAVNALTQIRDRSRYLTTLSGYVGFLNQAFLYDPIQRRTRPRRKTLLQSLRLAAGIVVANSTRPLRIASVLGLLAAFVNVLYMGYIVGVLLIKDRVAEGWVTQSAQTAGMFFFVFLILAVLCEYVGRLLDEVKSRPLYWVQDERQGTAVLGERTRNVVSESTVP